MCEHFIDSVEDVHRFFLTYSKYISSEDVLYKTIPNIIDCDQISDLELLLCGSPDHGLNNNTQIFKAVHAYKAATKRDIKTLSCM